MSEVKKKRGRKPKNYIPDENSNIKPLVDDIKIPKKRGRKPKKKTTDELNITKTPKKRGRKPKLKTEIVSNVNYVFSKRGRKPKEKVVNINSINVNVEPKNNFIMHLPINIEDIENIDIIINKDLFKYNPILDNPNPYDPVDDYNSTFMELEEQQTKIEEHTYNNLELKEIEAHTKSDIKCYWCLEQFQNKSFILPTKFIKNTYNYIGCFCSPNCAASYNFYDLNDSNTWERYSLLNLLYNNGNKIYLAPPRNTLNTFGGNFNITKFRELTEQNKQVNLLYSPLASIVPQIEILNNDFNKPNLINLHQKTTKNNFFNN